MPNKYFRFKQFTVHQDKTAMKICTDACLFAAWVTEKMQSEKTIINNVLDIGTGTGLLSLILAQKLPGKIDAIEIDEQAAQQAKENFEASRWKGKLSVFNTSIQQFNSATTYDLIISNPPFFENSLKSNTPSKNRAKHTDSLSLNELTEVVLKLLEPAGKFCLLLPYARSEEFKILAGEKKLHVVQKSDVQQTPLHRPFRTIYVLAKESRSETEYETFCIKDNENNYSGHFTKLLQEYYLYL